MHGSMNVKKKKKKKGSCPLTRFIKVTSYVQVVLKAIFTLFLFLFVPCVTWELGVVIGVT
jgi:hypothetical protein